MPVDVLSKPVSVGAAFQGSMGIYGSEEDSWTSAAPNIGLVWGQAARIRPTHNRQDPVTRKRNDASR